MIYHGLALIISTLPALGGVLAELHARAVARYHAALLDDPLTRPLSWVERRHMRRRCATCSLLAELATTHAVR